MNTDEILIFREEFKKIIYQKGLITESELRLKRLYIWDKNGSHENAIKKELDVRDNLKVDLRIMLKNKSYDEWKQFSKKLSLLNSRLNKARESIIRYEKQINELKF